jgi:23S rRNA (cytidine1920-2'-O)/16S rRNA (cytidine1409-2'-O)-methyltransferase
MRIDRYLVEKGLVTSRRQAQDLIAAGRVYLIAPSSRRQILKPSENVPDGAQVEVTSKEELRFVSRGGLKLEGALKKAALDPTGMTILDVGISTGGFSDCLLQHGASLIVGVDVGHGQLATKLHGEPRIKLFEGINARDLSALESRLMEITAGRKFALIVIDVSFISLRLVLPEVVKYLCETGRILALVKPQFEAGREAIGKGGIVREPAVWQAVQTRVTEACQQLGLIVENYFASSVEGADGNQEFFILARKS